MSWDPHRLRNKETPRVATPRVTPPDHVHTHHPHVPSVHLNLNVRGLSSSASLAINERIAELVRDGREIFKLGLGQSPFPVPEPVVEALRDNAHRKECLAVRGLAALREAVAGYHHRRQASCAIRTTC